MTWSDRIQPLLAAWDPTKVPAAAFEWGECWSFAPCYPVPNVVEELGFWVLGFGLRINAFGEDFAMVMAPDKQAFLSFELGDSPAGLRLEWMVRDLEATVAVLRERGIEPESGPTWEPDPSPMGTCDLRTPSGVLVRLWCVRG